MRRVLLLIAALVLSSHALAQHTHGDHKGPNGGQMRDVAGVEAELLASGNSITVNIFDDNDKPVSTKGFSGAALVVDAADRETVALIPFGDNSLKATAKKPINAGSTIAVTLKTATGRSGQAKFRQ